MLDSNGIRTGLKLSDYVGMFNFSLVKKQYPSLSHISWVKLKKVKNKSYLVICFITKTGGCKYFSLANLIKQCNNNFKCKGYSKTDPTSDLVSDYLNVEKFLSLHPNYISISPHLYSYGDIKIKTKNGRNTSRSLNKVLKEFPHLAV